MKAETYLQQIKKIDVVISNRQSDKYGDGNADDIAKLKKRRQKIIHHLERLLLPEYEVLYECYVNGKLLKELCSHFNRSYPWVKAMKRQALEHLQEILDEEE